VGDFADLVLRELAERELAARELLLRESPKKVRLIFCGIERTQELITLRVVIMADTRVVTGGQAIGADLTSHAKQRLELYVGIAVGAGDRRTAAEIVVSQRGG
jgi:hypothetical protein